MVIATITAIWGHIPFAVHHMLAGGVAGAATGAASAAKTDWAAFKACTTPEEFAAYNWKLAAWRWFHGAVVGFVTGLGIGPVVGAVIS